ncbi:MAG: hypothetical protein LBK42_10350 [Propionibacteriaceae bacterium]|jgi:hypothetical protein|nr:hypothetical protein [Propionibacteriaceae bacterium]
MRVTDPTKKVTYDVPDPGVYQSVGWTVEPEDSPVEPEDSPETPEDSPHPRRRTRG